MSRKLAVKIGIIGGSGLDDPDILENRRETLVSTPFGDPSDVLIEGTINGVPCVLLARHGRKHTIMPSKVNYRANIWALREIGCTHILASAAVGSLQEEMKPGDLVLLDSFIDNTKSRIQTFYNGDEGSLPGICHLPMRPAFCPATQTVVLEAAKAVNVSVKPSGTIAVVDGPRFSSLAESNMYRILGAHLVGMTTVPEVVLAKEAGLCYITLAVVTDYDCWRSVEEVVSATSVIAMFQKNVQKLIDVFRKAVSLIAEKNWDESIEGLAVTVKTSVLLPH
ncbi:hypothetical protein R5R35_005876 [Gryllus longicercus]|uniref:S-methyl-5'-thioadenosine phosphorylase n=1 Tax=Gryllus longicercus TaxID=2509291 RepID=A0AAN9V9R2_9ORTH